MKKGWLRWAVVLMLWMPAAWADNIVIVGDSISAAFGLDSRKGWAALLEQRLHEENLDYRVINASVSGDTSAGGLARLPALLQEHQPVIVIIELGGNDGLRGQPPAQLQQNLARMVTLSQQAGAKVALLGMTLPPNYGARYINAFNEAFTQVAEQGEVAFLPFFLEGVGGVEGMMQGDGVHPTEAAQPVLLENAWSILEPLL